MTSVWKDIRRAISEFPALSLIEERRLIAEAKKGSRKAIEELVLRHLNFIAFRINRRAFPCYRIRFGDDILSEAVFLLYDKIKTYNLRYKDKQGNLKPVRFSSYIWKRVDGFILDFLKESVAREKRRIPVDWDRYDGSSAE